MADDEPVNRSDSFACSYRLRSSARFFGQAGILVTRPQPVVSNFKIRPAGAARPTTRGRNRITARDCSCNQAGCTIPSQLDRIRLLRSIDGEQGRIGDHGRIAVAEGVLSAIYGDHERKQKARAIGTAPRNQRTLIANSAAKDRSDAVSRIELILTANCENFENLRLNDSGSSTLCDRGHAAVNARYPSVQLTPFSPWGTISSSPPSANL
jgi:hypothetical protein